MNTLLVKFIVTCFVCEFTGLTACVPLKHNHNRGPDIRLKRSPANNFRLFRVKTSFSAPDPTPNAHQTFNNFGKSLTSVATSKNEMPWGNIDFNVTFTKETTTNSSPTIPLTTIKNIPLEYSKNSESHIMNLHYSRNSNQDHNETPKKGKEVTSNDKELIDFLFKSAQNENFNHTTSTIEDNTLDFTTETVEYESTTIEEMTRIPSQVVAGDTKIRTH